MNLPKLHLTETIYEPKLICPLKFLHSDACKDLCLRGQFAKNTYIKENCICIVLGKTACKNVCIRRNADFFLYVVNCHEI